MHRCFRALAVILFATVSIILPSNADAQPARKALTIEAIFDAGLSASKPSQIRWLGDDRLSYLFKAEEDEAEKDEANDGEAPKDDDETTKGGSDL